jgi:hypothetical protein
MLFPLHDWTERSDTDGFVVLMRMSVQDHGIRADVIPVVQSMDGVPARSKRAFRIRSHVYMGQV